MNISRFQMLDRPIVYDKLSIIIDIFSKFYGEQYRSTITNRLKKAILYFYNNPNNINEYIKKNNLDIPLRTASAVPLKGSLLDKLNYYGILDRQQEIVTGKIPFSNYVVDNNIVGVMPCIINEELVNVLYFPTFGVKQENLDCVLVHELLHIIEEHIIVNNDGETVTQGGFETTVLKGNRIANRKYEYLNELVHQRIAEDITKSMHDSGIFIFNTAQEAQLAQNNYCDNRNEVEELFYQTYRDIIIEYKFLGRIQDFIEHIGQEKFEQYNNWIKTFYKCYPTINDRQVNIGKPRYQQLIDEGKNIVLRGIIR